MNNSHSNFEHTISASVLSDKTNSEIIVWVFPIIIIIGYLQGTPSNLMLLGGVVSLFVILSVVGVQYEVVLRLAGEVTATDTHLVVTSGSDTVKVPYDITRTVSYSKPRSIPDRITLHLFDTKIFGGRLSFKPEEQFRHI